MSASNSRRNTNVGGEEAQRSVQDWGKLTAEVLRLKCNEVAIVATGKKAALVQRLFAFYNSTTLPSLGTANHVAVASMNTHPHEATSTSPLAEIQIPHHNVAHSTEPARHVDPNMELVLSELAALRSQIGAMQSKQTDMERKMTRADEARNIADRGGDIDLSVSPVSSDLAVTKTTEARHQFASPPPFSLLLQQQQQGGNAFLNPFIPPPVKMTILKKIEKGEYIDLEDLMPNSAHTSSSMANSQGDNFVTIDDSQALRLRTSRKEAKILNFGNWMSAWVTFMQAQLYFKPNMYCELFNYLRMFVRHHNKYKFDACLRYDIDHRMLLATQASLAPSQRSTSWDAPNEELVSIHLQDNLIAVCFSCHSPGHFSTACPKFPKQKNLGSSSSGEQRFNNQQASRAPLQPLAPTNGAYATSRQSGNNICHRYNNVGFCPNNPCKFSHTCGKCGRNHPSNKCTTRGSNFFP